MPKPPCGRLGIIEAQRRGIDAMEWLSAGIEENGPARMAAEAEARAVPELDGGAARSCG